MNENDFTGFVGKFLTKKNEDEVVKKTGIWADRDCRYCSRENSDKEVPYVVTHDSNGTPYSGAFYVYCGDTDSYVAIKRITSHWGPGGDTHFGTLYVLEKETGALVAIASAALVIGGTFLEACSMKEENGELEIIYAGYSDNEYRQEKIQGTKTLVADDFRAKS